MQVYNCLCTHGHQTFFLSIVKGVASETTQFLMCKKKGCIKHLVHAQHVLTISREYTTVIVQVLHIYRTRWQLLELHESLVIVHIYVQVRTCTWYPST